jgi:glycosyltransferase involved in cell wall biosynthesis
MDSRLDIIIPVYNEGRNIIGVLRALARAVETPARVLICYDFEEDDTLPAIRANPDAHAGLPVEFVRNPGRGAHAAVMAGFAASRAPLVVVYPADDDFNAGILDRMAAMAQQGCDVVCASRFMPGGTMEGCPWLKAVLVRSAAFTLHHLARLPTRDATSGFRLFSRHRIAGEGAPAWLGHRRGAGAMVRAQARREPVPRAQVAAGLSALVRFRLRHHPAAAAARHGGAEAATVR